LFIIILCYRTYIDSIHVVLYITGEYIVDVVLFRVQRTESYILQILHTIFVLLTGYEPRLPVLKLLPHTSYTIPTCQLLSPLTPFRAMCQSLMSLARTGLSIIFISPVLCSQKVSEVKPMPLQLMLLLMRLCLQCGKRTMPLPLIC